MEMPVGTDRAARAKDMVPERAEWAAIGKTAEEKGCRPPGNGGYAQ
jgi:hypothetical protein